jgi:hypothetical protein
MPPDISRPREGREGTRTRLPITLTFHPSLITHHPSLIIFNISECRLSSGDTYLPILALRFQVGGSGLEAALWALLYSALLSSPLFWCGLVWCGLALSGALSET